LTIFGAKKLAFFSKTNVIIKFFHNLPFVLSQKRQFFAEFFGENILKIITSIPGHPADRFLFMDIDFSTAPMLTMVSACQSDGCHIFSQFSNFGRFSECFIHCLHSYVGVS
jgi:hypothetical protein